MNFDADKELKKLKKITKAIPADKKKLVEGLIADASFMAEQLEKLRPILQKLAMVYKMPVEDVFIKYMDLATEAALEQNRKFEDDYKEILGETPKPKYY